MFTMDSIRPVSDFSRKPAEHIKRLKETGMPEVLTVNGKAELVIQDAKSYEEMTILLSSLRQIAKSVQEYENGNAKPVKEVFSNLTEQLALRYPDADF